MVVKILSSTATFNGVKYNTDKIDNDKGELMKVANFGLLDGLSNWRPQDYKNYLKAMSSRNKLVTQPQFHAVVSAKGRTIDKYHLLEIAEKWLDAMGYGKQPYLVVYHKDTDNNHIHLVSTRINWDGRKINDSYEKVRAIRVMEKIMQQDAKTKLLNALAYRFTTLAQFKLILQSKGQHDLFKDIDQQKVKFNEPSKGRAVQLTSIFRKYAGQYTTEQFAAFMKQKMGVELIFHFAEGKTTPYGYTVLDHAQKNAYKGSQIMPMKELLSSKGSSHSLQQLQPISQERNEQSTVNYHTQRVQQINKVQEDIAIPINISGDIDDEAIHGRRRKKKPRANHR